MSDTQQTPAQRVKSPLLYQLSYRDETHTPQGETASPGTGTAETVGAEIGVIALAARLLNYNPETGALTWKMTRRKCRAGAPAGSLTHEGYVRVDLTGRTLQGHRLAWMLMTGEMPPSRIDHINGDRADNRWSNLRAATATENAWNAERNATGVWRRYGKVYGRIRHDGRVISAGPFATEAEATAWYHDKLATLRGAWSPLVSRVRGAAC